MFLKALTLKGFKSFADTTTLTLEPGVTVVVGPNGSGKSNVVDAIAWVLGAQAPSAVRSQKMDDVIFAGTAKRPALGRAEVSLTIDNSAGLLPIEFTEVTITRTLFRTGESEYAINGTPCRLLDVQDLLSDSGVGRQQHVIVSQGQIDAVLNARPEERRAIIEEAAGVLKYRKRKERAERRLEATEANLLRVQDLLREVRRQLRPLERQAEAAKRHGDVMGELNGLRVFLAGREIAGYRDRLTAFESERTTLQKGDADGRGELEQLDAEIMTTESQLAVLGGFDLGDQLVRTEQLVERARGLTAVLAERRRGLERDRGRLLDTGVVANLEAEAARLVAELADVVAGLAQLGPDADSVRQAQAELDLERAALEHSGAGALVVSAAGAAAEIRGELRTQRGAVERGAGESARLAARLASLTERSHRLESDVERNRTECEQSETSEAPLVGAIGQAEQGRARAEADVERCEQALRTCQADASRWSARAEALGLALDAARARAGAERLADVAGVVGTLLDLVDVDEGWEAAFEAAAGEALSAVVVDGLDAARLALTTLHDSDIAGAVLALDADLPPATPPAVGEPVRRHVRSSQVAVNRLLDGLVGAAVAVEGGWPAAVDVVLKYPGSVVVTRDGGRFGRQGWRVGGAATGATGAALDEARREAQTAETLLAHADAMARSSRLTLAAAVQVENDLTRQLDAHDSRFAAASQGLERSQAEKRETATEIESLATTAYQLDDRLQRERDRIGELESLLPDLEAQESAEVESARAAQVARISLDRKIGDVGHLRKEFEVRSAGLEERQLFLRKRLAETEERLQADSAERASAETRRVRVDRSLATIDQLAHLVDRRRVILDVELADLQAQRRRQSEQARAVGAGLEGIRRRRSELEVQLNESRERLHRIEVDESESRVRLETVTDMARREFDLEPDQVVLAEAPEMAEGVDPFARAQVLERELRIMGPINPLALEEFTALEERHTFLETQLEDVRSSRRELAQVIKAVDDEIQSVFASAFADVALNFDKLFAMLFPGGTGRLTLTNPDDMLNTGIEVEAKPSGKNVKKLSLLSGGERSLTALAYLFAVFRSRPSPFYVMDEVEAALDDVNLHRFLGLVDEFRGEAQLMIVSHQKRTMEAADCLYGVTMQPGGSSRVVSEKVNKS